MLGLQSHALQELVTEAVVEGAVEAWGAPVGLEHPEALHLILTVHKQLCLIAIDPHQDYVLQGPAHIAANQLVGDAVCESLQEEEDIEDRWRDPNSILTLKEISTFITAVHNLSSRVH